MDNSSRALIAGGLILIAVAVVSIGIFVFSTSSNTATDALSNYSAEEINAFNTQYEVYLGTQKGSSINSLIGKLISSANSNKDNLDRVPAVTISDKVNATGDAVDNANTPNTVDEITTYISNLSIIKQKIESKHEYNVEFKYGTSGFINEFIIYY